MTKLEQKALYAVTEGGRRDLLSAINPHWLSDSDAKDIWAYVLDAIIQGDCSPSAVKNVIMQDAKAKAHRKDDLRLQFQECLSDPIYPDDLPGRLLEAHQERVRKNLIATLNDPSHTIESHIQAIESAREAVKIGDTTGSTDMDDAVEDYYKTVEEGKPSAFRQRIMTLRSGPIRTMFDGRIYPVLYIIAARPGFSKTQTLYNIAEDLYGEGRRGVWYSFEDNKDRCRAKWIALRSGTEYNQIINETIKDVAPLRKKTENTSGGKLDVIDRRMTPMEWERDCRSRIEMGHVDFVLVDYLQLFRYDKRAEVAELNTIINSMTSISNDHIVPIVCLSQVNNREEEGGEVKLHMGHLKGTGGIEEGARMIYAIDGFKESTTRNFRCLKNSYHAIRTYQVEYDLATGRIIGATHEQY